MSNEFEALKKALQDPIITKPCGHRSSDSYVSVWSYEGLARQRIEYREHNPEVGERLKALHSSGFVSGRPRLAYVFTPQELCSSTEA